MDRRRFLIAAAVMTAAAAACDGSHPSVRIDAGDGVEITCASCHGTPPPPDMDGNDSTERPGVGAHQAHLKQGDLGLAVKCEDCHVVPEEIRDPGHLDDGTPGADVVFSGIARSRGAAPEWAPGDQGGNCYDVYCHGGVSSGGSNTGPRWTKVDGSQKKCGSCHGLPPPQGHPRDSRCFSCHAGVVDGERRILNPALHVDGKVDLMAGSPHGDAWMNPASPGFHGRAFNEREDCGSCHGASLDGGIAGSCERCHPGWKGNCTFCHGGADNPTGAPPRGTKGEIDPSEIAVGAHSTHVMPGDLHPASYGCEICHLAYASADDPGHIDGEVEVAAAGWNSGSYSCSGSYCHGGFDGGNRANAVKWNVTDGSQVECGTCHARIPSSGIHPAHLSAAYAYDCGLCHAGGAEGHVDGEKKVEFDSMNPGGIFSPSTGQCLNLYCHGDGKGSESGGAASLDGMEGGCAACHGYPGAENAAELSAAHARHVSVYGYSCSKCHEVENAHVDGKKDVIFDGFNPSGAYDRGAAGCSGLYCHSDGKTPSSVGSASWPETAYGCNGCHGDETAQPQTLGGSHAAHLNAGLGCESCHSLVAGSLKSIIVPSLHADGMKQVSFPNGGVFSGRRCSAVCHGARDWEDR